MYPLPLQPAQWFVIKCDLICYVIIFSPPILQILQGQARCISHAQLYYAHTSDRVNPVEAQQTVLGFIHQ